MIELKYTVPEIKPYDGPDPDKEYPGENDLVWCDRCKINHRRGPPPEVFMERLIRKQAEKLAKIIEADTFDYYRGRPPD